MNRRRFLRILATAVVGLSIAGCAVEPSPTEPAVAPEAVANEPPTAKPSDPDTMVRLHLRAECYRGEDHACPRYALLVSSGVGGPADQAEAHDILQLACGRGHAPSCRELPFQKARLDSLRRPRR